MSYTAPTAADLKARFPAFAAVADATVTAALTDATRQVDESWIEGDFATGRILYACHLMTMDGLGATTEAKLSGFTSLSIGPLKLDRASTAGVSAGQLESTSFGVRFKELRRANCGGARVTGQG